jgi:hypothetical protein
VSGRVTYNPVTGRCQWSQYSASPGRALYAGVPQTRILNVSFVSYSNLCTGYYGPQGFSGMWYAPFRSTCTLVIRLTNPGNSTLTVTNVNSGSVWSLDWSSGTIAPGTSQTITCFYSFIESPPIDTGYVRFSYDTNKTSGNAYFVETRLHKP